MTFFAICISSWFLFEWDLAAQTEIAFF